MDIESGKHRRGATSAHAFTPMGKGFAGTDNA
jgi:hypothetical protein